MRFDGKVTMVLGGSSGIGRAAAVRFAAEGARVAVVASVDQSKAQAVSDEIEAAGGEAGAYACDVRNVDALRKLTAAVESDLGPVDILINSAGLYYPTPLGETAEADYDRMADINLKGTFYAIDCVAPGMKARRYGKIVNVSSVAAVLGIGTYSLYCATKAAVAMLTKTLARELAPFDINVNAIAPGNTATPLNEHLRVDPAHREYIEGMEALTPSNRAFSSPEEMAALCLYLASDDARSLHGSLILADQGISSGVG